MLTKYFFFYVLWITPLFSPAQNDVQTSIITDDGIFTVSQTDDGKDMILFNIALWDDMMKGTKYVSKNPAISKPVHICIEIAGKKKMHCGAGIGFRCGIYDCNCYSNTKPVIINNTNRVCSAMIQKQDPCTMKIIFLDNMDWCSLQTGQ